MERLSQLYEDALTRSGGDAASPEPAGFIDECVGPLTALYVDEYANTDDESRETLIHLLAAFKDLRTAPAMGKALDEFAKGSGGEKDAKWASRTVRDLKLESLAPSVFAAFKVTQPSTKRGAYYRDLNEAVLAVASPSWAPELIAMVETDFPSWNRNQRRSPEELSAFRDQAYRTITASQVLGELRDPSAVRPLIRVLLDPTRADAANEAVLALVKIGKPASDAAARLLAGQDEELAAYHKVQIERMTGAPAPKGAPHTALAATLVGALGRPEGVEPLVKALRSARDDSEKVPLLAALAMLPHTAELKRAFSEGFRGLPAATEYEGQDASTILAEAAALFFDAGMTDMLVQRARSMKRDKLSMSLLALAAMKTMDSSQVASVKALVASIPPEVEEGPLKNYLNKVPVTFELTAKVLETCGQDAACYIAEAAKLENQSDARHVVGIKALYMFGQLLGPEGSRQIIEVMPALEEPALRYVASQILDHHHPNGSLALADQLQAIINTNADSGDQDRRAGDKPLRDVMYRLRARAQ